MTKTAKEILERVYSLGSKAQQSATPKAVDILGERVVENNLKDLEAIMLKDVIGGQPSKMNTDNWKIDSRVAKVKEQQRYALRQALYGEEK